MEIQWVWETEEDAHLIPRQLAGPVLRNLPKPSVFLIYCSSPILHCMFHYTLHIQLMQASLRDTWQHYLGKWVLSDTGEGREEKTGSGTVTLKTNEYIWDHANSIPGFDKVWASLSWQLMMPICHGDAICFHFTPLYYIFKNICSYYFILFPCFFLRPRTARVAKAPSAMVRKWQHLRQTSLNLSWAQLL